MSKRQGGIIFVKADGRLYKAKGSFTYNLGKPQRNAIIGSDGRAHGFSEQGQVAYIEGEFTDDADLDLATLVTLEDATVTLELANDKVISLREAWYAGDGNGQTEEGNITARFDAVEGEEIR
ncbi:phage tail tube protein [Salinicola avicenniae]|uniref:phage tail tube protein n=1 Tax=Salinicola avicenniae TaxID=2916836 RepID=UPI0020733AF9|nr:MULTISPECIES: phage tail tube protein [unclassified Salinicola]